MPQADPVRDKCSQLILPIDQRRKHVANIQGVNFFHPGILQRRERRVPSDLTQRLVPMFADGCLSDSENGYFLHEIILPTLSINNYPDFLLVGSFITNHNAAVINTPQTAEIMKVTPKLAASASQPPRTGARMVTGAQSVFDKPM